jgi:hypothetical protein
MGARISTPKARIKTGTYVGDGAASHAITSVGFQPDFVLIMPGSYYAQCEVMGKTADMGLRAQCISQGGWVLNAIISLDSVGFTVSSTAGVPYAVNTLNETYYYLAIKN